MVWQGKGGSPVGKEGTSLKSLGDIIVKMAYFTRCRLHEEAWESGRKTGEG